MSRSVSLLHGGPIYTVSSAGVVDGLAWKDGTIAAVGGDAFRFAEQAEAMGLPVERIALEGRFAMPGFVDAHCHLSLAALTGAGVDVSGCRTVEEVKQEVSTAARFQHGSDWLRITGYDWRLLDRRLTREDLDDAGGALPMLCVHYSLHEGVLSTAGFEALAWNAETPDPPGGRIERDAFGVPTGRLIERAHAAADATAIASLREQHCLPQLIRAEAARLLRLGITCLHDAAVGPEAMAAYQQLAQSTEPFPTVVAMPHGDALFAAPDPDWIENLAGGGSLRIGPVKLFADGATHPCTRTPGRNGHIDRGYCFTDSSHLAQMLEDYGRRGFGVAVHVMGNRALGVVLQAIEAAGPPKPVRLEHVACAEPSQVAKMTDLQVTASVQPGFVEVMGDSVGRWQHARWLGFAEYLEAGLPVAAGSDHPCSAAFPLKAISHGVTRRTLFGTTLDAEQAVPVEAWLHAYTLGAARAAGLHHEMGSLTSGKRADIVVLSEDPRRVAPELLDEIEIDRVWLRGRVVPTEPTTSS